MEKFENQEFLKTKKLDWNWKAHVHFVLIQVIIYPGTIQIILVFYHLKVIN